MASLLTREGAPGRAVQATGSPPVHHLSGVLCVVAEPDALRVSFLQIKLHRLGCLFSGWSCSFGDDRGRMKGGVDSRQVALMACGPKM